MTRTILIERHGPPEALVERVISPRPPGAREVQLRVRAAGVNFADLIMRTGLYATVPPRPYAPGFEVAGEVAAVGPDVADWAVGDRAVALMRFGGYAEEVTVGVDQLFRYPDTLDPAEAAAIPVAFLTAWVCLFHAAHAQSGETTLILNAAGGVGTAAVQLARHRGVRVLGTAGSDTKRAFVTDELGAERCFDSRGDWEADVRTTAGDRGLDIALDPLGGTATRACRRLLGPLGRLVFYGMSDAVPSLRKNWLRAARAWWRTRPLHPYSLIQPNLGVFGVHLLHLERKEAMLRPALERVFALIESGALRPVVHRRFPLTRAGAVAAHHHLHDRKVIGKVVLERTES